MKKLYSTGDGLFESQEEAELRGTSVPVYLASDVEAFLSGWEGYAWVNGEYVDDISRYFESRKF